MGSFLGLRKSKKTRLAEEAAAAQAAASAAAAAGQGNAAALAAVAATAAAAAAAVPQPASLFRRLMSGRISSPQPGAPPDSPAAFGGGPGFASPGGGAGAGEDGTSGPSSARAPVSSASFVDEDGNGAFLPSHHVEREAGSVRSALKGGAAADLARRALERELAAGGGGGGGGGGGTGGAEADDEAGSASPSGRLSGSLGSATPTPVAPPALKRRISFADDRGFSITDVRYSTLLHYSEGAEHEADEDDGGGGGGERCAVM
jgi:hypothetical protein